MAIRSILITGGTGTFGQAFAKTIVQCSGRTDIRNGLNEVQRVCIYSRGEHAQATMRERMAPHDPEGKLRYFVGDVRDVRRLQEAMTGCDTVIHAAALKRIEVGAYNPSEMVKTNVIGTMHAVQAATAAGVKRFVFLSSDKAYQPISPYGQSKALAESLVLAANHVYGSHGPRFMATRYGNIWNAQGSIVPKWRAMLDSGILRLPLTDPECTRFFMTIDEAVELVWDMLRGAYSNTLVIPDSLPAYRLGDLADAFLNSCSSYIAENAHVEVVGLPSWEKQHESMREGLCSADAPRMTPRDLREALAGVGHGY